MKSIPELLKEKPWLGWLIFGGTLAIVFLLGLIASSIVQRRAEASFAYAPLNEFSQFESNSAVWGENYPRQYQSYLRTADTSFTSQYGGSAMRDMLEEDPRLVVLWAGYSFSKEYNQGRGHQNAITDIHNILRTGGPGPGKPSPQPNTCWTCKGPDVPRLMNELGIAEFYRGTWDTKGSEVTHPIGCADCHDAKTMNLRISRPALVEAYERQSKDITQASHQEMRSLVCAQCHVEYYFNKNKVEGVDYLTFPWDKGTSVDSIEAYYDQYEFSDWTHGISKAPMLKAQHPDHELFLMGTHSSRGVACADCHMPYKSEGSQKFTDHHVQSPLNNVANSCQVCHREETDKLVQDVYVRQEKLVENRDKLEILLVKAHVEAGKAWELGADEKRMKPILHNIRRAQWRWDFVAASHGASFHAPVETARIIAAGIDLAGQARVELARTLSNLGWTHEVPYPDIDTKEKAQKYIGLDMKALNEEKNQFLREVLPEWTK